MPKLTKNQRVLLRLCQRQARDIYGTAAERVMSEIDRQAGAPLAETARWTEMVELVRALTPKRKPGYRMSPAQCRAIVDAWVILTTHVAYLTSPKGYTKKYKPAEVCREAFRHLDKVVTAIPDRVLEDGAEK